MEPISSGRGKATTMFWRMQAQQEGRGALCLVQAPLPALPAPPGLETQQGFYSVILVSGPGSKLQDMGVLSCSEVVKALAQV